jgi:hypothetical protein
MLKTKQKKSARAKTRKMLLGMGGLYLVSFLTFSLEFFKFYRLQ